MKIIDLFSGCGGFSRGFVEEGFKPVLAIELDEDAAFSYALNFNGIIYEKIGDKFKLKEMKGYVGSYPFRMPLDDESIKWLKYFGTYRDDINPIVLNNDIREIHSLDIERFVKKVDVIIGGPPCEGYTGANPKREKNPHDRLYKDDVGRLVLDFIRIVGDLQPKVFVMENVPAIRDVKGDIIKEFRDVGYEDVYFNILRAEDYGNPSVRRRVFVSNIEIIPEKEKPKTVIEAIGDLMYKGRDVPNHEYAALPRRFWRKVHYLGWGDAFIYFKGASRRLGNYIRLHPLKLAETVMGKRFFIHPYEDRLLTPREQARLMSYPDNHLFVGGIRSCLNQIGESVPPCLSRAIAKVVKENL
ncbi:DNA-cytosine methyltransferase [Methanocaldococcus villosus KIN24-T80]|uniref:DNA (cytosine-5-)-methyltransferase n=1 Tax=Methanocaldococcus villosus KIN24-T80 TaxID=1069083 RepID=N6VR66_9EURY|nr:DNA cytosine methyltransferase [Methanocaldococcus villosus]ENN95626.1 DNA-cytosine methyltransferase [Methanocaldococcus villosus KIN24-T80]